MPAVLPGKAVDVPELVSETPDGNVAVTTFPLPVPDTSSPVALLPVLFTRVRPVAVPARSFCVWSVTVSPPPDDPPPDENDQDDLRRKIDELQKQLAELSAQVAGS